MEEIRTVRKNVMCLPCAGGFSVLFSTCRSLVRKVIKPYKGLPCRAYTHGEGCSVNSVVPKWKLIPLQRWGVALTGKGTITAAAAKFLC